MSEQQKLPRVNSEEDASFDETSIADDDDAEGERADLNSGQKSILMLIISQLKVEIKHFLPPLLPSHSLDLYLCLDSFSRYVPLLPKKKKRRRRKEKKLIYCFFFFFHSFFFYSLSKSPPLVN